MISAEPHPLPTPPSKKKGGAAGYGEGEMLGQKDAIILCVGYS